MKAVQMDAYGGPEVLVLREAPDPEAGPVVQFHSPSKGAAEERRQVDYGCFCHVELADSGEQTRADGALTYSGTYRLQKILGRLVAAVRGAVGLLPREDRMLVDLPRSEEQIEQNLETHVRHEEQKHKLQNSQEAPTYIAHRG